MSSEDATTKRIYILAGPNGAGKTTFAREFLTHEARCPIFINADLIADGLSPFAPERVAIAAGRIMLAMIHQSVQRGDSFGFETTLAGRGYARLIPKWRSAGHDVRLPFLSPPTPEAAIARVSECVRQGGHSITEEVIRRRFRAGFENFERLYKPIVTSWILYESSQGKSSRLLNTGRTHDFEGREWRLGLARGNCWRGGRPQAGSAPRREGRGDDGHRPGFGEEWSFDQDSA